MIILHLNEQDEFGAKIKQELENLCVAFETKTFTEDSGKPLPAIEESGRLYTQKEEIESWLSGLRAELTYQRSLTGDGCYIDPETGEVC